MASADAHSPQCIVLRGAHASLGMLLPRACQRSCVPVRAIGTGTAASVWEARPRHQTDDPVYDGSVCAPSCACMRGWARPGATDAFMCNCACAVTPRWTATPLPPRFAVKQISHAWLVGAGQSRSCVLELRSHALVAAHGCAPALIGVAAGEEYVLVLMELLDGITLDQLVRHADGRVPLGVTLRLCERASRVLVCTHTCGIAHRDVHGDNLMLTAALNASDDWRMHVIDFGMAMGVLRPGGDASQSEIPHTFTHTLTHPLSQLCSDSTAEGGSDAAFSAAVPRVVASTHASPSSHSGCAAPSTAEAVLHDGPAGYMSPELERGLTLTLRHAVEPTPGTECSKQRIDGASAALLAADVWALGCTLHNVIFGDAPMWQGIASAAELTSAMPRHEWLPDRVSTCMHAVRRQLGVSTDIAAVPRVALHEDDAAWLASLDAAQCATLLRLLQVCACAFAPAAERCTVEDIRAQLQAIMREDSTPTNEADCWIVDHVWRLTAQRAAGVCLCADPQTCTCGSAFSSSSAASDAAPAPTTFGCDTDMLIAEQSELYDDSPARIASSCAWLRDVTAWGVTDTA